MKGCVVNIWTAFQKMLTSAVSEVFLVSLLLNVQICFQFCFNNEHLNWFYWLQSESFAHVWLAFVRTYREHSCSAPQYILHVFLSARQFEQINDHYPLWRDDIKLNSISCMLFKFSWARDNRVWLSARVRDKLSCRGTTAATRVPRWRIGERPREVAQEGSTG